MTSAPSDQNEDRRHLWERIEKTIWHQGFMVLVVDPLPEENVLGFAHTIGLLTTFQHPEIIVFGLEPEIARQLLTSIGYKLQAGMASIEADYQYDGLASFPVRFKTVLDEHYPAYLVAAWSHHAAFRPEEPFRALQMIWPDPRGSSSPWPDGISNQHVQPTLWMP